MQETTARDDRSASTHGLRHLVKTISVSCILLAPDDSLRNPEGANVIAVRLGIQRVAVDKESLNSEGQETDRITHLAYTAICLTARITSL